MAGPERGEPPDPGPPLLGQLKDSRFVLDLKGEHAGDSRPGPVGGIGPRPGPIPCVVLVGRAADAESNELARFLTRIGIDAVRVVPDDLAGHRAALDISTGIFSFAERLLRPTVVWERHFSGARPTYGDASEIFSGNSWTEFVDQLGATAPVRIPHRRPGLLEQLAEAARLGLATPRTLVGTDPAAAAAALSGARIVVKSLGSHFVESEPGLLTGVFAEVRDRAVTIARGGSTGPPMVFQEYLEHECELRVYYVHGEIHAYAVAKPGPAAPWTEPSAVRVCPAPAGAAVQRAARALAGAWGADYCAFDFLIRAGEPVFLEANLNGDWRWFETVARDRRVTHAAVRMLRDLHVRAVGGRDGALGPISFLCG
jgi:hypothetical protein